MFTRPQDPQSSAEYCTWSGFGDRTAWRQRQTNIRYIFSQKKKGCWAYAPKRFGYSQQALLETHSSAREVNTNFINISSLSASTLSVGHFPDPFSSRWCRHSSCHDWTTATQPCLAFRHTFSSSSSQSWTRPRDSFSLRQCTTTSVLSYSNYTGWEHRRGSSSSLLFLCTTYTSVCMGHHRRNSPMSLSTRQISRSGDAFDLLPVAECLPYSAVHHLRSGLPCCCCPYLEQLSK